MKDILGSHPYLPHIQQDNRPRALDLRFFFAHPVQERGELVRIPFHDAAGAEKPHDAWREGEGAEHDRDAPVFVHVRDGFAALFQSRYGKLKA